jgi:single-strand DNA-binding protein
MLTIVAKLTEQPVPKQINDLQTASAYITFNKEQPAIKTTFYGQRAEDFKELEENTAVLIEGTLNIDTVEQNGQNRKQPSISGKNFIVVKGLSGTFNSLKLVGRVGADPDMKYFDTGKCVAKIPLAVNKRKKDAKPNWFDVEVWDRQAEIVSNYVNKGKLVEVEGNIQYDVWADKKTGEQRMKLKVRGNNIQMHGGNNGSQQMDGYNQESTAYQQSATQESTTQEASQKVSKEKIPF